MSDTPRTTAAELGLIRNQPGLDEKRVMAAFDFGRQLERELEAANQKIADLSRHRDESAKIVNAFLNACGHGPTPFPIGQWRELFAAIHQSVNDWIQWHEKMKGERDAIQLRLSAYPADWTKDSSLETWFPQTSQELTALRHQVITLIRERKEAQGKCNSRDARIAELEKDLDYHKKLCIPKTLDELEAINLRSLVQDLSSDADTADMRHDEFSRIETLTNNDGGMTKETRDEILWLCRRAKADIKQRVPVIQQRDTALAERDAARKLEATCHCGEKLSAHRVYSSCTTPVEQTETCPYSIDLFEARAALAEIAADRESADEAHACGHSARAADALLKTLPSTK